MSREVLGSAVDDLDAGGSDPDRVAAGSTPVPATRSIVRLDAKQVPDAATSEDGAADRATAVANARAWAVARLDAVRASRQRTATALVVVAVVGGLVAVGATEQARQAGRDRAASVVAWLDVPAVGVDAARGRAVLQLNVVNTGADRVTVTGADLDGGLQDRSSGVGLELTDDLVVEPQGHGSGRVEARVEECSGPVSRGGSRDGDLRVRLSGADLRETVLDGTRVGAFPVTSSSVVELACGADVAPVVVQSTMVRADGRLYITLRGSTVDVEVGVTAPDGVRLVTDPPAPVPVPGGQDAPMTTIPVTLEVDVCTVSAQQLDAGRQVSLVVGGDRYELLDHAVVNAWVAREVIRACG